MARRGRRVDQKFIDKFIANQFGVDIETTGSMVGPNEILQIGITTPGGMSVEMNILQQQYVASKFHSRTGGLDEYYKQQGINPEIAQTFQSMVASNGGEKTRRYMSTVLEKEKAKALARTMVFGPNGMPKANMVIHNANFEIKHFAKFFGKNSPFRFSQEYQDLILNNRNLRFEDELLYNASKINASQFRAKDAARQISVYDQIIADAAKGGAIIDTMEIAKTANALAQQAGIVEQTGDLALGTNVELLAELFLGEKEVHRAVNDVWQQNKLAPELVRLVEKLKNNPLVDDLGKATTQAQKDAIKKRLFSAQEIAWLDTFNKDHVKLKVESQRKAIKQAVDNINSGYSHTFKSNTRSTRNINDFVDYLSKTGRYTPNESISQGVRLVDHGASPADIVKQAIAGLDEDYAKDFAKLVKQGERQAADKGAKIASGMSSNSKLAAGIAVATVGAMAAYGIARRMSSGNKDDHNTIEGLRHGYFGSNRNENTDFGSGYKGPSKKVRGYINQQPEVEENKRFKYGTAAGLGGAYMAYRGSHHVKSNTAVNALGYLGPPPAGKTWEEILGRKTATYGDLLFNAVKRFENSIGGLPRAFSISSLMSPTVFKDSTHIINLVGKGSASERQYYESRLGMDFFSEGIESIAFRQGKLVVEGGRGKGRVLLSNARLYENVLDSNIVKSPSQFAKALASTVGADSVSGAKFIVDGANSEIGAIAREAHVYLNESFQKYLRLMDDPTGGFRDLVHGKSKLLDKGLDIFKKVTPQFGVGKQGMKGGFHQLLGRHAIQAIPRIIAIPLAYKTLDWAARQIGPEDSVMGKAGITGLGAEAVRLAHMTYGHVSEMAGLTSLREKSEENAPGMSGFRPFLGMTLGMGFMGMSVGALAGLAAEVAAENSYGQMVKNMTGTYKMPGIIGKIPGMGGKYSMAGIGGRAGLLVGAALGLPMLFAGLGSSKSVQELEDEYSGKKEIAVRKGRWWEFGMTPYEGGKIEYYRPNWYQRLLANPKDKQLYDGEDISPIGKFWRTLKDPYWLEKMHYEDRPYPVARESGEQFGIFRSLYEMTVGPLLKPTAVMHTEDMMPGGGEGDMVIPGDISAYGLESESGEVAVSEGSPKAMWRQAWRNIYDAFGLRGFFASSVVKESLTGDADFFTETPVMQSSSDMESPTRDFYDSGYGGGATLTEPVRRFLPSTPQDQEFVNTIPNTMPKWLPGEGYMTNFQQGDPYTLVKEGEYRLPGKGYEARFPELEGTDPDKYPLVHRYKILADVATYSNEYQNAREQMKKANLTEEEQEMFRITEDQVAQRMKNRTFNYEDDYKGIWGAYTRSVASLVQRNPLEQLTPFSPGHKFLPQGDALAQYEDMVYGKEFKKWQNPVDDFIKPFLTSTGNLVGYTKIPDSVQEVRDIEQYFDELKYVKFKRLQETAKREGQTDNARMARNMLRNTALANDPYSSNLSIHALPKREKEFLQEIQEGRVPLEDRQRMTEMAPDSLRDIYQGQSDLALLRDIEEGNIQLNESEKDEVKQQVNIRKAEARARQRRRQQEVMNNKSLPSDDWEGWDPGVDLEDVKMKYLLNEGKDTHYYNLWSDRARRLRTNKRVTAAVQQIDPEAGLPSEDSMSEAEVLKLAEASGLDNVSVMRNAGPGGIVVDTEYDSVHEQRGHLRDMGMIV